jgi:hypothetical protein
VTKMPPLCILSPLSESRGDDMQSPRVTGRLSLALDALVTQDAGIHERLAAARDHVLTLESHDIDSINEPDEREQLNAIMAELQTAGNLTSAEGSELAGRILEILCGDAMSLSETGVGDEAIEAARTVLGGRASKLRGESYPRSVPSRYAWDEIALLDQRNQGCPGISAL